MSKVTASAAAAQQGTGTDNSPKYVLQISPKMLVIPTKKHFAVAAKTETATELAKTPNRENALADGLVRDVTEASVKPVREGFANNNDQFDSLRPMMITPFIEKSPALIQLYRTDLAGFWVFVLDPANNVMWLIIDGAHRWVVSTELALPWVWAVIMRSP